MLSCRYIRAACQIDGRPATPGVWPLTVRLTCAGARLLTAAIAYMSYNPPPALNRAPRSTAEQLQSTAMPGRHYPIPPKPPKPEPPPIPKSTAEQQRSSSMAMSQTYEKPPPQEAAGKASGAGRNGSSSIFGDPPQRPPPPPKQPKGVPNIPTSKAAQGASTVFGTPRHERPADPEKAPKAGNASSKAAQGQSNVFETTKYERPPDPPKKVIPIATSKGAQGQSSVFGSPRYELPPKPEKPPPAPNANTLAGQNASSVFGTPRYTKQPAPGALLSQQGGCGDAKGFAPGEWLMPTPRSAADGAPKSKEAQAVSASLPGTRYERPPPPPKEPPIPIASSKAAQGQSSVFGVSTWTPPPKVQLPPQHGPFPGQTVYKAPPKPPKEPPLPIAASKADQGRSSVFGPPSHDKAPDPVPRNQSPREYTGLRLAPPKSAENAPPLPPREPPRFVDENGKSRPPITKQEQQTSVVFGGTPTPQALAANGQMRINLAKSFLKIDFDGLPPDADSHRLHQALSALPYDAGITVNRSKVKVAYGSLDGKATGKGSAQFRNVPDGDRVMAALGDAQAKGIFGRNGSVRIAFDDRKDAQGNPRASGRITPRMSPRKPGDKVGNAVRI